MTQVSNDTIPNEDLEEWKYIGYGGFGNVYKAEHKTWGVDLAIKLPKIVPGSDQESEMHKEADYMKQLSFEHVVKIYGIYDGIPPFEGQMKQKGIVMEYMSGGGIDTLLRKLAGPPPLPLAFRLAHQVILGINFLHSKNILHHDLKPCNVLLTEELNAKLADFGLSRFTTSVLNTNSGNIGGTLAYTPPEALNFSYKPVRSFDIYSYSILLWSIFTGKEPYEGKHIDLVKYCVQEGHRPDVELCRSQAEGMDELVELMMKCWDGDPEKRPKSEDIKKITHGLFLKYKHQLNVAIYEVKSKLDSQSWTSESAGTTPCIPQRTPEPEKQPLKRIPGPSANPQVIAPPQEPKASATGNQHAHTNNTRNQVDVVDDPGPAKQPLKPVQEPSANPSIPQVIAPPQVQQRETPKETPKASDGEFTVKQKAKFVDDKMPQLVGRIGLLMPIVDELRVNEEAYSTIYDATPCQKKVRLLYETVLNPEGEVVKAKFFDALKKHNPYLMDELVAEYQPR